MPQERRQETLFTYRPSHNLFDVVNRRIARELSENPRLTMAELARRVGMSSPAVIERVRRLEEADIIRGYRLDLDPGALGLPITAFVRVRPNPGQLGTVADLACRIPEVVECHRITGEDCFILQVHIPAMDQLDRLLDRFLAHGTTTTSIVQSTPVPRRSVAVPPADDSPPI